MWRSLIHLDLSLVQEDKNRLICILLHASRQLSQHHLLKRLSFFHWMELAPLSKSSDHRCVGSFLGFQFYSVDLLACHCTNTMQVLTLFLCSTACGLGYWFLQKFFYCWEQFLLSWVFWYSRWIWEFLFLALWRIELGFWWGLRWICILLLAQSMSMGDLSIFWVFFDFFLQRLEVLVIQIFHLFG